MGNEEPPKRRIAIYIRVSTQEQEISGYSTGEQENHLLSHVNDNPALNMVTKKEWFFSDTHTGSDLNRTGYKDLMKLVRSKKVDAVLVWKIDRLSRSLEHLLKTFEEMKKYDVSFISLQENIDFQGPIGNLIFQIFGAIAQFERELIRGRTNMGKQGSAKQGNFIGAHIPYGYDKISNPNKKGSKLFVIPKEADWVRQIFKWYVFDGMGRDKIAKELNLRGVPLGKNTRAKKHFDWNEDKIETVLKCEAYTGSYLAVKSDEYGKGLDEDDYIWSDVPQIISEYLLKQAQEICKNNKGGSSKHVYLLSGKLRDPATGLKFVGAQRTKGGFSYRRKKKKDTKYFEIPGKPLDEAVWQEILRAFDDPDKFIKDYLVQNDDEESYIKNLRKERDMIIARQREAGRQVERYEVAMGEGAISMKSLEKHSTRINEEISKGDKALEKIQKDLKKYSNSKIESKEIKNLAKEFKGRLEDLPIEEKQAIMQFFVEEVLITTPTKDDNDTKAEIKLRFQFQPKGKQNIGGRVGTQQALGNNKKPQSMSDLGLDGGQDQEHFERLHISVNKIPFKKRRSLMMFYSEKMIPLLKVKEKLPKQVTKFYGLSQEKTSLCNKLDRG